MEDILTEIITEIIERKRAKNITPDYALFGEVMDEINSRTRSALNKMFADDKINVGDALNDRYLYLR